jgi:cobalt-zinc-cadmium efflux system outer membrane protein
MRWRSSTTLRWIVWAGVLAAGMGLVATTSVAAPVDGTSHTASSVATHLTLDEAMARVERTHPELRRLGYTDTALHAAAATAAQRPPTTLGFNVENAAGTGQMAGVKSAEFTLTLASVLERGGKREAREALAASRIDALGVTRVATRLDLLAETARRYLDVVAAQAQASIASADVTQRQRTVVAARRRVQAGASPQSAQLTAEAMQTRADIDHDRAMQEEQAAYRRLAILWGDRDAASQVVDGDPLNLPSVPSFDVLMQRLVAAPELQQFASEERIREARVQLARSEASSDITWQWGVRRLQNGSDTGLPNAGGHGDWAMVGGVSIPLGSASRAAPERQAAEADLAALSTEREARELTLSATLAQAYGQYVTDRNEVTRLRDDLLPKLVRAQAAAERAYQAGALSYLEWAQLQSDTTAARKQQLATAIDAQRALIEIQRLTGDTFITSPSLTTP